MKQRVLCLLIFMMFFSATKGVVFAVTPILPLPLPPPLHISTVPANGDLNPYGVAFVPSGFPGGGMLNPGNILVSNFNDSSNTQGTGTTIVQINPNDGSQSLFFQGRSGLGLTTALGVLKAGFVIVGNVPTPRGICKLGPHGQEAGVQKGSLLIIDSNGNQVKIISSGKFLEGPWDMTIDDEGENAHVFVSNVLSGTVTRLDLNISGGPAGRGIKVLSTTQIASGYFIRCDPAALVVGPTGLAYDKGKDILYVASTGDNTIFSIANAGSTNQDSGKGAIVYQDDVHLHGPLGLVLAPNGDLISSQGDAVNPDPNQQSEFVEFTPEGVFQEQFTVEPAEAGAAFGLAFSPDGLVFAAVDDFTNELDVWTFHTVP